MAGFNCGWHKFFLTKQRQELALRPCTFAPLSSQTIHKQITMNTNKEIRKLRKDLHALREDVQSMKYQRLDSLIAQMKDAAREMLEASRL